MEDKIFKKNIPTLLYIANKDRRDRDFVVDDDQLIIR